MKPLGKHILGELYQCNSDMLNETSLIEEHMVIAAEKMGATIVNKTFHHFSPHGVSGTVIIAESHLAIHTWPEYFYAAVDFFTCGDSIDSWIAFEYLCDVLQAKNQYYTEVQRGHINPENKEVLLNSQTFHNTNSLITNQGYDFISSNGKYSK